MEKIGANNVLNSTTLDKPFHSRLLEHSSIPRSGLCFLFGSASTMATLLRKIKTTLSPILLSWKSRRIRLDFMPVITTLYSCKTDFGWTQGLKISIWDPLANARAKTSFYICYIHCSQDDHLVPCPGRHEERCCGQLAVLRYLAARMIVRDAI